MATSKKIPEPDTQNAYAQNGTLNASYVKQIVGKVNRVYKISVNPQAATSTVDDTDTDISIVIGTDIASAAWASLPTAAGTYVQTYNPASGFAWVLLGTC